MDTQSDEDLLEAYESERIDPKDTWEQERLYEFEGFVVLEHLQLLEDEIEQQDIIDAEERLQEAKQYEQDELGLLHLQQSDQIDFLLLQLNQPLYHE